MTFRKNNQINTTNNDLDTSNKVNGYALQYDSDIGKFVSKPLPSGSTSASFVYEDWTGETVYVFDNVPPLNITKLNVTYLAQTNLTLNWTESTSVDVQDYLIYNSTTLIATVLATSSKLQQLMYQVTGLLASTNYTFTVKSRDVQGNISSGVSIAIKSYGIKAISMNGTSDYIKLPSMMFDTVELTCQTDLLANTARYYLDARSGVSATYFRSTIYTTNQYGGFSSWKINNGDIQDINYAINNKMTLTLSLASTGTDDINIFSQYQLDPNSFMPGKVYSIRIFNGGVLVAYYDLTSQFAGTSISDLSGSGRTATLNGGTWVTG